MLAIRSIGRIPASNPVAMNSVTIMISMNIRTELWLFIGIGIVLSIVATFPLFQHSTYISNHGDINRGLIYSGVARDAILSGHMPTWNPYLCGGGPLLADVESWFLQPFFFLTLPFD